MKFFKDSKLPIEVIYLFIIYFLHFFFIKKKKKEGDIPDVTTQ